MGGVRFPRVSRRARPAAGAALLAAALLLPNLGEQYLWQDEAQTALLARTILRHGVPLGSDGRNYFSQELGKEYGPGGLWRWHTWLSFYAVAASFAALGEGTAAARLPSALFGVATVVLAWWVGHLWWRDERAAATGALLLALSVPFLILSRQCRYHSMAACFCLLGLVAYARIGSWRPAPWLLFGAATLLFHTHFLYAATLLGALLLHAFWMERARLAPTLRASAGVALVNLPWIVWLSAARPGGEAQWAGLLDPLRALRVGRFALEYASLALEHLFPAWLLLAPLGLAAERRLRRRPQGEPDRETRSAIALVGILCAVHVLALAALSPLVFYRYLAPLAPPLAVLAGLLVASLWRRNAPLAAAAIALFALAGGLPGHLRELTGEFAGPVEGLVAHLREHGRDTDTVAITYDDLPLKFYTRMRVVGGLTGEDLAPARDAEWIVPRRLIATREERRVRRQLLAFARAGDYEERILDAPDTRTENREHPALHRFEPAPADTPRLRVFRRRR